MSDSSSQGQGPEREKRPTRDSRGNETRNTSSGRAPQRDSGQQKPWEKRDSADRRPARDGERKPWENRSSGSAGGDRRPARDGERKPWENRDSSDRRPPRDGERKPWENRDSSDRRPPRDGERKPWENRNSGSAGGDRRPPRDGERKPWENRDSSDRRPPRDGERKPWENRDSADRRPPRDGERKPWENRSSGSAGGDRRPPRDGERKPWENRDSSDRRPPRDGERKPWENRDSSDRRPPRDGERKPWENRDSSDRRPPRDGDRRPPRAGGEQKLWTRDGAPARNDREAERQARYDEEMTEEQRRQHELRMVRPRHDDPDLPDDVTANDLDRGARNELKTLTKDNAEWVAKHLAMAARLIDEDPELAHKHVLSAARRAGRIAIVRETLAVTAYATGDFALALRELRTYRRISGKNDQIALMVDSERGVGRPDRALELGRSIDRTTLPDSVQVELAIAMSGARLDLEQPELALVELEVSQLDPNTAFSYSPPLFAAYAEVLEELGRDADAAEWRARANRAAAALGAAYGEDGDETISVYEEELDYIDFSDEEGDDGIFVSDEPVADEPVTDDSVEDDAAVEESVEESPVDTTSIKNVSAEDEVAELLGEDAETADTVAAEPKAEEPTAEKPKKAPAKKAPAKKAASAKEPAAKKAAAVKEPAVDEPATTKPAAKKATAKKSAAEPEADSSVEVAEKVTKAPAKKAPAKKAPAKKVAEEEAPVKKAPTKKVAEKKAPAKKTTAVTADKGDDGAVPTEK